MGKNIAGVVLAGGKSSRMGQNKAFLDYNGKSLLDHMIGILQQAGLSNIYVSGEFEGYNSILDRMPYEGPARAILNVLATLGDYDGALFIPVDMPFLSAKILQPLIEHKNGASYEEHPLPAFITSSITSSENINEIKSVRDLLKKHNTEIILLSKKQKKYFANINTPEEWKEALRA